MNIKTLISITTLAAAFLLLYHEVLVHIFSSWSTRYGSHGPLILGVSLYLIWLNRHKLRSLQPQPSMLPGALLLSVGLFIYFSGIISSTLMVMYLSVIPVLLGIILLYAGFSWFKIFLLPVGYLVFLTGFIERLLGSLAIYLQQLSAWIAAQFFKLTGFTVFHDNTLIMLPHISLDVVRSCSGISHIVSLLALAVPLAYLTQKTISRKIILIVSSLLIGLVANGLRVFLIGIYALYNDGADLHGPAETLYVSFIFFFGLVVLILFSRFLSRKEHKSDLRDQSESFSEQHSAYMPSNQKVYAQKRLVSILLGGIIFLTTLGLVHLYKPEPVDLALPLNLFPDHIAGFSARDLDQMHQQIRPFPADEELMRAYKDKQGNSIKVYIGYFRIQDRENKIIDYRRAWIHEEVSKVPVETDSGTSIINKTRLRQQALNSDIYFWYQMDDRIITNEYAGKFFTFMDALLKRQNNAAVIVINTRSSENQVMPFLEQTLPLIQTHLSGGN